jgi:hypothetical protein
MGIKKKRDDDWIFFTCLEADGVDDLQNLAVERRRKGNKMGIKKNRENRFGSSVLIFAKEQEDSVHEIFVKSRDRKER